MNLDTRIADRAAPGRLLVSGAVVEAAQHAAVRFTPVGPVELKGAGAMPLFDTMTYP